VNILRCLNWKWFINKEELSWTISLWELEQSHIFFNSWKKFKHQRSDQANQGHILLRLSSVLFSRSLSSQNSIQSVGPRLLEEKNSHGYPSQNSFFKKFSSFVGNTFSMGLQPSYLRFQASKASLLSLKGLCFQGLFGSVLEKLDCLVSETGLSGFCGFNPLDRTYPFTYSLTSLSLSLKNNHEGDPKTHIGDSLVPS
jgi:hypothetical protein